MSDGRPVRTTCPYCGVGCGILATRAADGSVRIEGDPEHPANFGRLCSKGSALAETLDLEGRLLTPEIDGRTATWDAALDLVAARFAETIREYGPDAVAFYVSGQLLTEDYYVANKLMKGFIGSANIDTNSRLCMASSVAGHRRAFGSDTVPGTYEDLELADLVVLVGSNLAWCHPVLYQRLAAAKAARPGMKVVLVDPRRTMTADIADLHLAIAPDGDVALFLGLLGYLATRGTADRRYVEDYTDGFDAALSNAEGLTVADVASRTGLAPDAIARFFALFADTEKTVTVFSQGVNQSASGTDKVNAIINCHLATGRIGRPGTGPFSVTGQPNAMGGREVGGLANILAAHLEIEKPEDRDLVQGFWASPTMAAKPGLKAIDMFRAVADGRIKAIWIMATNPVASLPEADAVADALRACPFVVVSDVVAATDTTALAHVKLPAGAWGEKDGTVTNSDRRISRQRPFLPLPGETRSDWWIVAEVGRRMGFTDAFAYDGPAQIFAEHAALSAHGNGGHRDFDIGAHAAIDRTGYDALAPFQWPARAGEERGTTRFFADGGYFRPGGRARFVPVALPAGRARPAHYPLTLNTGRVRDHWHTMTRTGKSPRLSAHLAEPFAEIHPTDARRYGIADAELVRIASAHGEIVVRAFLSARQAEGAVFVPMHWTDQVSGNARVGKLIPARVDPHSGQPASKNVAVRIERYAVADYGFAILHDCPGTVAAGYWAAAKCAGGWRLEMGGLAADGDLVGFARTLFGADDDDLMLAYHDAVAGQHRLAAFDGTGLIGALFVGLEPVAVSRAWAVEQLAADMSESSARLRLLAGRAGADQPERGAIVCACLGVGFNQIVEAIASVGPSRDAVRRATGAGTNCGSCRAEINGIIDANRAEAAE